jgi:hypothetical protein
MKYKIMYFLFRHKLISEKRWKKYCKKIFNRLLIENTEVFIRLKNN